MKARFVGALLAGLIGFGAFFTDVEANASTIQFSGRFGTSAEGTIGPVFSAGQTFNGTVDYNPAAPVFSGGGYPEPTSSFAVYNQAGAITVQTGGTNYSFPLWETLVSDNGIHLMIQFEGTVFDPASDTNFYADLIIGGISAQNALLLPSANILTEGNDIGGSLHIWLSDASQGRGLAALAVSDASVSHAPLRAALPLFATGLGAMGLFGWWRKRKAAAAA